MPKTNNLYLYITLSVLVGILIGMIVTFFIITISIERILDASQGFIDNINIDVNETKIVESTFKYLNSTQQLYLNSTEQTCSI